MIRALLVRAHSCYRPHPGSRARRDRVVCGHAPLPVLRFLIGSAAWSTEADVEVCQVSEIGTAKRRRKARTNANSRRVERHPLSGR